MANAVKIREQANDVEVTHSTMITPAQMINKAIETGSGVDVMERLLALQERYDAFNARKAFDDAMADLRRNLPKIVKSREVDFTTSKGRTHYKFEDLAEITEALADPMSDVGLSFRWYTDNTQGGVKVTCRITHRDGHYEETSLVGPLDATGNKNAIQAIGSAVSYLQRYTLKAAVGVAASVDDDAQAAGARESAQKPAEQPKSKADSRAGYAGFESEIRTATSSNALQAIWKRIEAANLNADFTDQLVKEINTRLDELRKSPPPSDDFSGFTDPNEALDRQYAETMRGDQ